MSSNNFDPLVVKEQIDLICQEKGLNSDEVIKAIENAIASAYRKEFGDREKVYEAKFDLTKGSYDIFEITYVLDEVTNPNQQINVIEARLHDPTAVTGDILKAKIDTDKVLGFGRLASQIAKQVLFQSINNARHSKIVQKFVEKVGDIVNVEIDYYHKGGYQVKLDQTFGYISKENLLPNDKFKSGAVVKALIVSITEDHRGNSKILLSRSHPDFVKAIIKNEIPEVQAGIVTIEKIAREAGFRSKVLVSANENDDVDPVGTILGKKNMRIINIMRQISFTMQEKIDIIESQPDDLELMIMDALEPAQIESVDIDEENKKAVVQCYKDEAALAVGKRGINIKLAQELLDIELVLEPIEDESQVIIDEERPEISFE
jgi:transcription termination/antitermination protein NusA